MVKKKDFKNVNEAFSALVKKDYQKKIKSEAQKKFDALKVQQRLKERSVVGSIQVASAQQRLASRRQRFIDIAGSRAEQLEIEMVSFDEVPMLHGMERERTRKTTISNRFLSDTERSVTDSFPD